MASTFWHRILGLSGLLWAAHCGPVEEEGAAPAAPPFDRESWGVDLELHRPGIRIDVRAAYIRDDLGRRVVQGDSGVQVEFRGAGGELRARMQARRLILEQGTDRLGLAGEVRFESGDSLQVEADTLVWEGKEERLWVPGRLRLATSSGWSQGRELRTDLTGETWSMEAVTGNWRGAGQGRDYEVGVRARREQSLRDSGLVVMYDSVEVERSGGLIRSPAARYSTVTGVLRFFGGVSGEDSTRRFAAREAEFEPGRQRLAASGGVEIRDADPDSGFGLFAAEVVEDRDRRWLTARGEPAVFAQAARRIEAATLVYAASSDSLAATGKAVFSEGGRRLQAARLVYERSRELLQAGGSVELQAPELEGELRGDSLAYDLQTATGMVAGDPVLHRRAEDGSELELRADTLYFDLERRQLEGTADFRLTAGTVEARADRGRYDAQTGQLWLAGEVVLRQERSEEDYRSEIRADAMVAQVKDGKVASIDLPGAVEGTIESSAQRLSWIKGIQGRIFLRDDKLERVELDSEAEVVHRHLGKAEVSRFRGQQMKLDFGDDGLRRVWVGGGAELQTRLLEKEGETEAAVNKVEGKEMEILFEDGSIGQVKMGPDIQGKYYPQPQP
jgi:lipopolysaccharide export system protein LptA